METNQMNLRNINKDIETALENIKQAELLLAEAKQVIDSSLPEPDCYYDHGIVDPDDEGRVELNRGLNFIHQAVVILSRDI